MKLKFSSLLALLLISIGAIVYTWIQKENERLSEAIEHYLKGEKATTIAEREREFNAALSLFLLLEKENRPKFGSGRLYHAIGITLFQLGNYPEAILYFEKAKKLMPRSDAVKKELALIQKKLFIDETGSSNTIRDLINSISIFSLPERLQIFAFLCLLLFALCSYFLWKGNSYKIKQFQIFCLCVTILIGLTLVYTRYLSPLHGILIHGTMMRKGASVEYGIVKEDPLPAGSKVEIVAVSSDSSWFKVLTPNGVFGYVQGEAVKLIEIE